MAGAGGDAGVGLFILIASDDREARFRAGDNVVRLVNTVISANKANRPPPFTRAAAIGLVARDVLEAVQKPVQGPRRARVARPVKRQETPSGGSSPAAGARRHFGFPETIRRYIRIVTNPGRRYVADPSWGWNCGTSINPLRAVQSSGVGSRQSGEVPRHTLFTKRLQMPRVTNSERRLQRLGGRRIAQGVGGASLDQCA